VVNNDKSPKPPKRRQLTHSRIELVPDSERTLAGIRYILSLPDREEQPKEPPEEEECNTLRAY
jgi:hypothetical protein